MLQPPIIFHQLLQDCCRNACAQQRHAVIEFAQRYGNAGKLRRQFLLVDIQGLKSDGTFADGGGLRWRPDQGPSPDWPTVSPRHGSSANALYFGGNVSIHPTGNAMPYNVDPFRTDSDSGIHWKN